MVDVNKWFNWGGDKTKDLGDGALHRGATSTGVSGNILGAIGGSTIVQKFMGAIATILEWMGLDAPADRLRNKIARSQAKNNKMDEMTRHAEDQLEQGHDHGLALSPEQMSKTEMAVTGVGLTAAGGGLLWYMKNKAQGIGSKIGGLFKRNKAGKNSLDDMQEDMNDLNKKGGPQAKTAKFSWFSRLPKKVKVALGTVAAGAGLLWLNESDGADLPAQDTAKKAVLDITTGEVTEQSFADEVKALAKESADFTKGLVEDASPENWSLRNYFNLRRSSQHGLLKGTAETLAVIGGQALDILNPSDVFSKRDFSTEFKEKASQVVDYAFKNTIGLPDIKGNWSRAVNEVSQYITPGLGAAKVASGTSKVFGFANSGTKLGKGADVATVTGGTTMIPELVSQ